MCLCIYVCALLLKAIPEMTYTVSGGMLNPTHSHTDCCQTLPILNVRICFAVRSYTNETFGLQSSGFASKHASTCLGLWSAEHRRGEALHQTNGSSICECCILSWFTSLYCCSS